MLAEIWSGDWSLPTVDTSCLQLMAYAKFSGAPIKLVKTNNPARSPTGNLPVFKSGKSEVYTEFDDIVSYFKKQNFCADMNLSPKERSDAKAYTSILAEKFQPALEYVWWVDGKNYVELTRPWYAKALPFPYNYITPGQYQRKAQKKLAALYGITDDDFTTIETKLYKDAQECMTMLSNRLGEQDFFFGRSPTSLDATIFAYLAPLLKPPFPNPALQNYLKACDNLVKFIVRILHGYFPSPTLESDEQKKKQPSKSKNPDDNEFPHKKRNQFFAVLFAMVAMLGYAFSSGLVQVEISENENDTMSKREEDYVDFFEDESEEDAQ